MEKEVNKKEIEEQIKKLNEQLEERKEYLNNETNEGYGNWAIDEKISELTAKIDELTELLKKVEEKENIGKLLEEKEKQLEEEGIPYGEWQLDEEWMKLKQEYDKIEIQEPNAKKKDKKEQVVDDKIKEEKENIRKMLEEKEKQLEEEGIPYGEWQLDEEWMKLKQEYDKIEIQEPNAKKKEQKEQVEESSRKKANNKAKSEQDKTEETTKKIDDDKKEKTEPEEGKSQEDNSDPTIIRVTDGKILDKDDGKEQQQQPVNVNNEPIGNPEDSNTAGKTKNNSNQTPFQPPLSEEIKESNDDKSKTKAIEPQKNNKIDKWKQKFKGAKEAVKKYSREIKAVIGVAIVSLGLILGINAVEKNNNNKSKTSVTSGQQTNDEQDETPSSDTSKDKHKEFAEKYAVNENEIKIGDRVSLNDEIDLSNAKAFYDSDGQEPFATAEKLAQYPVLYVTNVKGNMIHLSTVPDINNKDKRIGWVDKEFLKKFKEVKIEKEDTKTEENKNTFELYDNNGKKFTDKNGNQMTVTVEIPEQNNKDDGR